MYKALRNDCRAELIKQCIQECKLVSFLTRKKPGEQRHIPHCRLRCRVYVNVLLAFVAGRWRWALTQRRNSTREAIGWFTPSSDQLDHAGRRIRTRSAVGIFSTHRQRGRRHLRHKCGGSTLSDEEPLVKKPCVDLWDYVGTMASIHILARAAPATEESVTQDGG